MDLEDKNKGRRLASPFCVLAAAAAVIPTVAVVAVVAAAAAYVAEQEHQDDDPPPVVAAEQTADIVVTAHKNTSWMEFGQVSLPTPSYSEAGKMCLPDLRNSGIQGTCAGAALGTNLAHGGKAALGQAGTDQFIDHHGKQHHIAGHRAAIQGSGGDCHAQGNTGLGQQCDA